MRYVCLICFDEKKLAALSPAEMRRLARESAGYDATMTPVETATTVRLRNGKATVSDGPFAETKEQLGGFLFIDAGNLDEAIDIASRIPWLRMGSVEIRATQHTRKEPR